MCIIVSILFFNFIRWELSIVLICARMVWILSTPVLQSVIFLRFRNIHISNISFMLSLLSLLTFFWAMGYRSNLLQIKNNRLLILSCIFLIVRLQVFFISIKIFFLYIAFELSVIPIFIIIMGWGYQRERIEARLRLLFYTLIASIPLLLIIIWFIKNWSWGSLLIINIRSNCSHMTLSSILVFSTLIAFAVKLPIFGVHVWLPKAHVEAPVIGSIILAAILLKLGRYGLWVIIPLVYRHLNLRLWISISLIGAITISVVCVRLSDVKIIIAYSSVSHIALVLVALILRNCLRSIGALILILAHGASSSGIFLMSYFLYRGNHSRRLLLTKGVLVWSRGVPVFWFLILIANMAAPPTFNLVSEILSIIRIVLIRSLNYVILILVVLLRAGYSLVIYSSSIQGRATLVKNRSNPEVADLVRIFNHMIWVISIMYSLLIISL